MDLETLKEKAERAQKEIEKLLGEVKAGKLDRSKLETGLEEVQRALKGLDIHAFKHDPE
jgi:hypothetical protein